MDTLLRRIAAGLAVLALITGCSKSGSGERTSEASSEPSAPAAEASGDAEATRAADVIDRGDGLTVEIHRRGTGRVAEGGSRVGIRYDARVAGAEAPFDSTRAAAVPLAVELGARSGPRIVEGLRRGLIGLSAGTKATIRVPAALAWGDAGESAFGIPEKAEVIFDVDVVEVQ
jgi:FKBP-type peptidyl-prolyl cis-trans isomerase